MLVRRYCVDKTTSRSCYHELITVESRLCDSITTVD